MTNNFDQVSFIMEYEAGEISNVFDFVNGFCQLRNSGALAGLQGSYQRQYSHLFNQGFIIERTDNNIVEPNVNLIDSFKE